MATIPTLDQAVDPASVEAADEVSRRFFALVPEAVERYGEHGRAYTDRDDASGSSGHATRWTSDRARSSSGTCGGCPTCLRLATRIRELEVAQERVRAASLELRNARGILSASMGWGRVRDDREAWIGIEEHLEKTGLVLLNHCSCPTCERRLSGEDPGA